MGMAWDRWAPTPSTLGEGQGRVKSSEGVGPGQALGALRGHANELLISYSTPLDPAVFQVLIWGIKGGNCCACACTGCALSDGQDAVGWSGPLRPTRRAPPSVSVEHAAISASLLHWLGFYITNLWLAFCGVRALQRACASSSSSGPCSTHSARPDFRAQVSRRFPRANCFR